MKKNILVLLVFGFLLIGRGVFAANGDLTVDGQIISTAPTGTAPFEVSSTTAVSNLTAGRANSLTMQGEGSLSSGSIPLTFANSINVTAGDRLFVSAAVMWTTVPAGSIQYLSIYQSSGTATTKWLHDISGGINGRGPGIMFSNNTATAINTSPYGVNAPLTVSGILEVTGSGTLSLQTGVTLLAGSQATVYKINGYYFFLKKQ